MPVEIKNLTSRPVLMRLNSGTSLHLSPGATSSEIVDHEVSNNEKVIKLQGRHIIALQAAKKKTPANTPNKTSKSTKRKK